jgi:large repetitive protein
VVTPPADITIDAVGLFTPVSLGTATAYDVLDGTLIPSSDGVDYYRPGSHQITWRATDAAGNTGSAIQTVNVIPLVSFAKDQTTTEGTGVRVRVILNGSAVSYPVTVPYVLAGSAAVDGSDHDLTDGVATISSGLETQLEFTTLDDGPGEGAEQIVITMETPTNAVMGAHSIHTIQLLEGNVPPRVDLSADQGMGMTHTVVSEAGPVVISSQVTDPNLGDQHSYDWSATDSALSDLDTVGDRYTFDPSILTPGLYTLRLTVSDGSASDTSELSLNVIAAAPDLSSTQDSDGDGTDDASEGFGDSDNDGVADYLDAIASANVLQEQRGMNDNYLIEGEPSLRLQLGRIALQRDDGGAHVGIDEIQSFGGFDGDSQYDYPGGLFDFVIEEVPVIGQSLQIVLPQLEAIPSNAIYRKAQSGGWRDFVVDEANSLASAPGSQGYCPPPGDIGYIEGLNEGHWCVQLTLEEGGPNDADGLANNAIEDPGGVASRVSSTDNSSSSKGGGGGGIDLLLLWLLLSTMAFRTRASKQNGFIPGRMCLLSSKPAHHK